MLQVQNVQKRKKNPEIMFLIDAKPLTELWRYLDRVKQIEKEN